jgi:Fe-S oxidoreductase
MAGAFGHETEHYDVARAVGEQRLFPVVREARRTTAGAAIAVSGFSCRHQIEHHTGIAARHLVELLADALLTDAPGRHDATPPA